MNCFECGAEMVSTVERYRYDESGLPNVWLENVEIHRCPECGEVEVVIPGLDTLHRVIAERLARKPTRLTGAEIRFIRKTVGWSAKDLARFMHIDPATLSRWETGKENAGPQSDMLVRLLFVHHEPVRDYSVENLASIDTSNEPGEEPVALKNDSGTWMATAPAA